MLGRRIGFVMIVIGISLLIFVGYLFWNDQNRILSPVPEETGVKVIFITPTK